MIVRARAQTRLMWVKVMSEPNHKLDLAFNPVDKGEQM